MIVLLLAFFVRPVVGPDVGLNDELITLTDIFRDRLSEVLECNKPETGYRLARIALLVLARIVVADQADPRIRRISFDGKLRVLCEIADGGYCEAIHDYSLTVMLRDLRMIHPSRGRKSDRSPRELKSN